MKVIEIEFLNPKALQLLKGMQDLKLIKVSDGPSSVLKAYLKKMRKKSSSAPSIDEISGIVKEVKVNC